MEKVDFVLFELPSGRFKLVSSSEEALFSRIYCPVAKIQGVFEIQQGYYKVIGLFKTVSGETYQISDIYDAKLISFD